VLGGVGDSWPMAAPVPFSVASVTPLLGVRGTGWRVGTPVTLELKDRVEAIGGPVIVSAPEEGTTLRVTLPITRA
jgi:signal transduction histidine kinase